MYIYILIFDKHDFKTIYSILGSIKQNLVTKTYTFHEIWLFLAINPNLWVPSQINLCIYILIFDKDDFKTIYRILGSIKQNYVPDTDIFHEIWLFLAINSNLLVPTQINLYIYILIFDKHEFKTIYRILGSIKQNLVPETHIFHEIWIFLAINSNLRVPT